MGFTGERAVGTATSRDPKRGRDPTLSEMCRSIVQLRKPEGVAREELEAAALQFVRKISGFRVPSQQNQAVFARAVAEIADSAESLLEGLVVRA